MLVTNFGLVLYKHVNFYQFEETSSYWSVERISVFVGFSLVNQRHTSVITVYNRTVTNIENSVRAVHSCNSWLKIALDLVVKRLNTIILMKNALLTRNIELRNITSQLKFR